MQCCHILVGSSLLTSDEYPLLPLLSLITDTCCNNICILPCISSLCCLNSLIKHSVVEFGSSLGDGTGNSNWWPGVPHRGDGRLSSAST